MNPLRSAPSLIIGSPHANVARVLGKDASSNCFHYCAPTHGGWGVIRTAMLLPEMYMLFVCPAACGRHGAIAAIEQGCKERVGYLCIEESEIVMGSYENEIRHALPQVLAQRNPKPQAVIVIVSCIDDLLGTDYAAMLADFEAAHGIPFRLGRMNPISLDSALPPGVRIQRDMYDFLEKSGDDPGAVALIGAFRPLDESCELHRLFGEQNLHLGHISQCTSFAEFQRLANVRLNLVTRPEGLEAAANLRRKHGTPFVFTPTPFSLSAVERSYALIGDSLNTSFDLAADVSRRLAAEARTLSHVGQRTIAIDDSATCNPFDLARALIEAGLSVSEVFTQKKPEFSRDAFDWLTQNAPGLRISSPIHHSNSWRRPVHATADIAIGFTAAYMTQAPFVVPLSFDEGIFGHRGMETVLAGIDAAVSATAGHSLEKMVRDYGLVV